MSNPFSPRFTDPSQTLPAPPPWRKRKVKLLSDSQLWAPEPDDPEALEDLEDRANRYAFRDEKWEVNVIEAALILRRPILITGKPGVGKSSLAYVAAHYLRLGPVLRWDINSKSSVQDAIYRYDAVRRLEDYALRQRSQAAGVPVNEPNEVGKYFRLGPLGTALLPRKRPRVLLIDEIDKSDLDLPDDLLNILEEGETEIPELKRLNLKDAIPVQTHDRSSRPALIQDGRLRTYEFPLMFLTSNGERDFSSAFLRRCLRLQMDQPKKEELITIVRTQLNGWRDESGAAATIDESLLESMAQEFHTNMKSKEITTDQLLNTFFVRAQHGYPKRIENASAVDTSSSPHA